MRLVRSAVTGLERYVFQLFIGGQWTPLIRWPIHSVNIEILISELRNAGGSQ